MKTWWLQLNVREQKLIASLGSVLAIFILYSFIWQPLNENIEKGQSKLSSREALLAFVSAETERYKSLKGKGVSHSNGSLSSIINRSAREQNITITRVQPQSSDVQVWIDNVAFTQLLTWLKDIAINEGIQVKNIDLTSTELSGQVRVKRLQLGKG